jgi:hypothetical protein
LDGLLGIAPGSKARELSVLLPVTISETMLDEGYSYRRPACDPTPHDGNEQLLAASDRRGVERSGFGSERHRK